MVRPQAQGALALQGPDHSFFPPGFYRKVQADHSRSGLVSHPASHDHRDLYRHFRQCSRVVNRRAPQVFVLHVRHCGLAVFCRLPH